LWEEKESVIGFNCGKISNGIVSDWGNKEFRSSRPARARRPRGGGQTTKLKASVGWRAKDEGREAGRVDRRGSETLPLQKTLGKVGNAEGPDGNCGSPKTPKGKGSDESSTVVDQEKRTPQVRSGSSQRERKKAVEAESHAAPEQHPKAGC